MSIGGSIRVIATYQYISKFFNEDSDPISLAFGRAFDLAAAQFSYYNDLAWNRRKLIFKALRHFMFIFNRELRRMGIRINRDARESIASKALKCLSAFKRSDAFGLWREKTNVILVDEVAGIFAQPDFVDDYNKIIYELKTFNLKTVAEYVERQIRVFQLAYPDYKAVILGFPWREGRYIDIERVEFEPIDKDEAFILLKDLKDFALKHGDDVDKGEIIVEYPVIKYTLYNYGYKTDYVSDEEYNRYYKEIYGDEYF